MSKGNSYKSDTFYASFHPVIRPLPSYATPFIRLDFRCVEIVKYYELNPLREATPLIRQLLHWQRDVLIRGETTVSPL